MAKGKKKEELSIEEKLERALVPVEEQPYEVPENWRWSKLEFLADIKTGKKDANYGCEEGEYYFFTCASEPIRCPGYSFDGKAILLAGNGDISNISLYNGKFEAYQRTYVLEKCRGVTEEYLYYYFKYRWIDYNKDKMLGTAIPYIRLGNLKEYEVPIPPMSEQQRIVEKIERLFAKLDEVKEKIQKTKDNMVIRKESIFYKAFSGELTKEWRKLQSVKPEEWKEVRLIDVLKEKPRNGYSPKPVDYETPYKSMTLSATTSGVFKAEYFKFIDEHIEEDSYLWLKPGDILIQRANSLEKVGTSAIYNGGKHEFIYPDLMMKLQVVDGVSPEFIAFQLKTERVMHYIRSNATGTAGNMPKINQKVVSAIPVALPSREEQIEIVRILDLVDNKEFQICTLQEKVLEEIEVMRKSILKKAFCGELRTNNSEEESSVELLKQILEQGEVT